MADYFDLTTALASQAGNRGFEFLGVVATQITVGGYQNFNPRVTESPAEFSRPSVGTEQGGHSSDTSRGQPGHHPVRTVRGQATTQSGLFGARRPSRLPRTTPLARRERAISAERRSTSW